MRLLFLLSVFATVCNAEDQDSNHLGSTARALDSNLRKALLKALTELEAENDAERNPDSVVEKAKASAFSYVENSGEEVTKNVTKPKKQIVLIQKSSGIQHKPITTFIPSKNPISNETNQILSTKPIPKQITSPKPFSVPELNTPIPTVETPTTEESEAKVEDVQFFSAPLVAAFTVHQDEHGLPKSVEPIYKSSTNSVPVVTNFIDDQRHYQQELYTRQEQLKQENYRNQLEIQEKQRALEEQLYKLQRQQRQQQEFLLKQQELIREQERILRQERERNRIKNNDQPFVPMVPNRIDFTTQTPTKPSTVVFQSSVSFNPAEFAKGNLPLNAQQLPVKDYTNFRETSFGFNQPQNNQIFSTQGPSNNQIQANQVNNQQNPIYPHPHHHNQFLSNNQIHSNQIPTQQPQFQQNQNVQTINSIQPIQPTHTIQSAQPVQPHQQIQIQPVLTPPHVNHHHNQYAIPTTVEVPPTQNVRIYRQEAGTGNYQNFGYQPFQSNQNQQHLVQIQPSVQVSPVRFLRSNVEGPVQPPLVNHHLRNLLHQAGITKGRQEDLNIVSKVLSYNHFGGENFFPPAPGRTYHFPVHRSDSKG